MINAAKPDIVWIGLGAPKQENWMAKHEGRINAVMVGVGAGFDYFAGNIKRAPMIMQKLSLEWLYRLVQEPKRLYKRYFPLIRCSLLQITGCGSSIENKKRR